MLNRELIDILKLKENLRLGEVLEADNYTNFIKTVQKSIKHPIKTTLKEEKEGALLRDEKVWIMKKLTKITEHNKIIMTLSKELFAQELDRFIRGYPQPKTRLGLVNNDIVLLSERKNFKPLDEIKKERFKKEVARGKVLGLGSAAVMSVFLADNDRHKHNVGIVADEKKEHWHIVNIDLSIEYQRLCAHCLPH